MKKNIVNNVLENNMCAGCGICSGIVKDNKIEMIMDKNGYLRPMINKELTDNENKIIKNVCPGNVINYDELPLAEPLFGNIKSTTIGYALDNQVRYKGSSGGVISQLLIYLLEKDKIDEVIHIGVSEKNPFLNEIKRSKTKDDVIKNSGSRYSPSAPLENIDEFLSEGKRFAFVGKPCDIAALRSYSKFDKRVSEKILYFFSFYCAGIPSIEGTYAILNNFNIKPQNVKSFKYRGEGWPGLTEINTKEKEVFTMKYEDSWGKILNRHLQSRCKVCIDGVGEFADISCGDGWFGDEKGYPSFEEAGGRSLITTRTNIGQNLLEDAVRDGYLKIERDIDTKDIESIQPYQAERRKLLLTRVSALKLMNRKPPKYPVKLLFRASKGISEKKKIKSFLGTAYRVVKGKI